MADITIDGKTKLYGVIGNPVKHSFSPAMHSLAFQEVGINAVYLPFLVTDEQLPQLLNAFTVAGVQGFNITLPFKEKIAPYLDLMSEEAEMLQSVNTVVKTENGWKGYSTDGSGFVRSLSAVDIDVAQSRVILVGAGGAARAIAVSLVLSGVSDIVILNRTQKSADDLASLLQGISSNVSISTSQDVENEADILINATSVGMTDNSCPVSDRIIAASQQVIDIIYNPAETSLLRKAAERSIPHMNGLDMLLYQGIDAFEIWTGKKAPIRTMRQSLMASVYSG